MPPSSASPTGPPRGLHVRHDYLPKCSADIVTCSFLRLRDRVCGLLQRAGPLDGDVHATPENRMHRELQ